MFYRHGFFDGRLLDDWFGWRFFFCGFFFNARRLLDCDFFLGLDFDNGQAQR